MIWTFQSGVFRAQNIQLCMLANKLNDEFLPSEIIYNVQTNCLIGKTTG